MKICVLIPVYNEAKAIAEVVKPLVEDNVDVVVLDDGSDDNSGPLAKAAGATVLTNNKRSGKGATLRRGFQYSVEHDYDGVITMDGDGQHAVSDVILFIKEAQKNPHGLIVGNRMHNAPNMPLSRKLTNYSMSMLISWACHQKIPDTQCGLRYIPRETLESIHLGSDDYEIETEVLIKAAKKNYKIVSRPIEVIYRGEESHIHPIKDTVRFFSYFLKELFSK